MSCCENKSCELEALKAEQSKILKTVLFLNAAMFAIEMTAGFFAQSSALKADALDMLGDALVYAFSLYVVHRSLQWKARAALLKGFIMAAFGIAVSAEAFWRLYAPVVPGEKTMGIMALLALAVNSFCLYLLTRHRKADLNMSSIWLCSRNDIIANVGVLGAALVVAQTQSQWPDILMGFLISGLFLHSAIGVIRSSIQILTGVSGVEGQQ